MVFEYFSGRNVLYIKLVETTNFESEEVAPGVLLDFDEDNPIPR